MLLLLWGEAVLAAKEKSRREPALWGRLWPLVRGEAPSPTPGLGHVLASSAAGWKEERTESQGHEGGPGIKPGSSVGRGVPKNNRGPERSSRGRNLSLFLPPPPRSVRPPREDWGGPRA